MKNKNIKLLLIFIIVISINIFTIKVFNYNYLENFQKVVDGFPTNEKPGIDVIEAVPFTPIPM